MSLQRLLEPRSVALVGASADPKKISGMMVDFLHRSGYAGKVYPVNPRYESIDDWPCFPSVEALPETVDVVVVAVPVAMAFDAIEQAANAGVPFLVLMTGGFGEGTSGAEGERRRERLVALCATTGMRVLGPNTVGMVNFRGRLPLTFADWYGRDTGQRGGVAILTHSGSVGGLIFSSLQINKVGVDYWVATGNEANLEIADFIDYLSEDAELHTIACFMEGVMNGRKFMAAVDKAHAAGKRIVVLKAGDSEASLRSTQAHTIKSSSSAATYRGVFMQLGVIQVRSLQELTYCIKLLSTVGSRTRGKVGILSASGGACSLIADHIVDAGLALPELDAVVQADLARVIPEYGSTRNPVDLSADVVSRRQIIEGTFASLAKDPRVDTWLVFGRPVIDRYHAEICAFAAGGDKAVIVSSGVALRPEIEESLRQGGVAVLDDPAVCMSALGAITRTADRQGVFDWTLAESRFRGPVVEAVAVAALLGRHAVALADRGTPPAAPATRANLWFVLRQDADFGPVLMMRGIDQGETRDTTGSVRALPLDAHVVAAAIDDASRSAGVSLVACRAELARIALALDALYRAEPEISEVTLALRVNTAAAEPITGCSVDVVGATISSARSGA